jgi:hypothetical protein
MQSESQISYFHLVGRDQKVEFKNILPPNFIKGPCKKVSQMKPKNAFKKALFIPSMKIEEI